MLARSAFAPRKKNAPRPAWKVAEAFKQWLRGRPCACGGTNPGCAGRIEAAHVDHAGGKGIGSKVADRFCLPLSEACHRLQHTIGWKSFEAKFLPGKDAVLLTLRYWAAWPGKHAWEAKNGS
jgi:hypothetical protein